MLSQPNLPVDSRAGLNTNPGVAGSAWSQPLTPLDCHSENPAIAGGAGGFGVLDGFFSGGAIYHRYNESDGMVRPRLGVLAHEGEVSPSLSQDTGGGVYATWSTGLTDLRLAYSPNGGSAWDGPVTLANSTASGDRLTDPAGAVNGAGKGWAVALRLTKAGKALLAKDHGHLRATILLALKVSGVAKKTTRGISITTKHRR